MRKQVAEKDLFNIIALHILMSKQLAITRHLVEVTGILMKTSSVITVNVTEKKHAVLV